MNSDGCFEGDKHRYLLWRRWDNTKPSVSWCCLNPSTASGHGVEDPSSIKMREFSKLFGFGGYNLVNLGSLRATDPKDFFAAPESERWNANTNIYIENAIRKTSKIILAWGANGHKIPDRCTEVYKLIKSTGATMYHLGFTKDGHPKHPLMLPYSTKLEKW